MEAQAYADAYEAIVNWRKERLYQGKIKLLLNINIILNKY